MRALICVIFPEFLQCLILNSVKSQSAAEVLNFLFR